MWYDKFSGLPPHGSPLETVFVIVRLDQQQTEILQTRAMLQSIVGLHESTKTQDPAITAFQEYCAKMLPFIEQAKDKEANQMKDRLEKLVQSPINLNVREILATRAEGVKQKVLAKQFKIKPKDPGLI